MHNSLKDVDFSSLILGFSSAALHYTGHARLDLADENKANIPLARQNLNLIRLLKEKTQGNLTPEESQLIAFVISDLEKKLGDQG
jgi:hypothetical protein